MRLGLHVSISGKLTRAFDEGRNSRSEALQIFTASPRMWKSAQISEEAAAEFRAEKNDFSPIVVHSSYLINLGSKSPEIREKSLQALLEEVERCKMLGADFLVLHPGGGDENAVTYIAEGLSKALDSAGGVKILLENVAGEGSKVGKNFHEMKAIIDETTNGERLGVCFDTCHAFAAGYDLRRKDVWLKLHEEIDATVGFAAVKLVHLNDTKGELGSNLDRHANWTEGKLGVETLKIIRDDPRFSSVPGILETPGDLAARTADLKLCRELLNFEG
ncbi:MAG: deoxyribonuclease IV [Bacillota bacterium]|jgi:deoxyribonuclease-4|nr:deoxyribonuclease IV [Bacillota bacterium]